MTYKCERAKNFLARIFSTAQPKNELLSLSKLNLNSYVLANKPERE